MLKNIIIVAIGSGIGGVVRYLLSKVVQGSVLTSFPIGTLDELGAIGKGGLHLDVRNHLGDAVHHIGAGQHRAAFAHELCHGLAVACALHHRRADQRHGLGVVELQTPGLAALGQQGGGEDQQLVFFAGSQFHIASLPHQTARLSRQAERGGRFHGAPSCNCRAAFARLPRGHRMAAQRSRPCMVRPQACTRLECAMLVR